MDNKNSIGRKLFTEWAMDIAEDSKIRSTCLSRQVGAVIIKDKQIIATGYNGAPSGAIHCTDIGYCLRRKRGYPSGQGLELCRAGHAEANAIDQCARRGTSCLGATLYVTTQPCVFCCIHIIQAGIAKVIFKGEYPTGLGLELLKESSVVYLKYEDALEIEAKAIKEKHAAEMERVRKFLESPMDF
ncbi:MAG: cytidine/deoxycytidylate deaminase family protein [Lachnospiraceae bacterium]|nr:cytidine/deoxycytidylate deaminase family protein [Lachnospiraceae bacterium]